MCKDYIWLQLAIFNDHFNLVKVSVCASVRIHTAGVVFFAQNTGNHRDCEAKGLLQLYTWNCLFCQVWSQCCPCAPYTLLHSKGLSDYCGFLCKCPSSLLNSPIQILTENGLHSQPFAFIHSVLLEKEVRQSQAEGTRNCPKWNIFLNEGWWGIVCINEKFVT